MAQTLYLFGVQVTSITADEWDKQVVLLFVDQSGHRHSYLLRNYVPYILVMSLDGNVEASDLETMLKDAESVVRVETHHMTPLVGFTNSRQDTVFRVYYDELGRKYSLMKQLEAQQLTILHRRFSDEMQFLHTTGWTLHTWFSLAAPPRYCAAFLDHGACGSVTVDQLTPVTVAVMPVPPLTFAYLRLTIRSSTATRSNLFLPDHTIVNDAIQACELRLGRLDTATDTVCTVLTALSESELIQDIHRWFCLHSPCIVVHMSDPLDHLAYLHFRAVRFRRSCGLSAIRGRPCRENHNMQDKTFRDLFLPGRECLDLFQVLQKFMVSPNLEGYSLVDVFAHPNLLRCRDQLSYTGEEEVTLEPLDVRVAFTGKELEIMCALQVDNAFILNNLALSRSCDLSLFQIVSRGQQARVFACFARAYHRQAIYINHLQFERPYLLVRKKRSESSYPDPPWLENPPLETLRKNVTVANTTTKRPRVSLRELLGGRPDTSTKLTEPKDSKERRFGGGFVMAPSAGFYSEWWEAVTTLDFASLYPSIMEGYVICFMRVCYDSQWLEDPLAEKEYIPLDEDTCCVFIKRYAGAPVQSVTNGIVHAVVQNRKNVRAEMVRTIDPFVRQSLDAQQLCCKILQNAFYGACGSETFAIACNAIAASVCMIGQWMNKTVRYNAMVRGGRCVYGDTDSVMIQFRTASHLVTRDEILADIYRQARELEAYTTTLFPAPNAVEFESVKIPHLQTTKKKTYASCEYPPSALGWTKPFSSLVKGFAFKKRDRCPFVQHIGKALLAHLMDNCLSDTELVKWLATVIDNTFRVQPLESELPDFIITCRLNTEYKQENTLALHLASLYERELGIRPRPGRRLRYLITQPADMLTKTRHAQCAVTPTMFTRHALRINPAYYLQKQLLLSIKQILDLRQSLFALVERMIAQKIGRLTTFLTGRVLGPFHT